MSNKDIRYSHNYREPVYPHQDLPQTPKKGKRKRQDELELAKEEEAETGNEDEHSFKKRTLKRKLKKMESDPQKSNLERAGNKDSLSKEDQPELNPVMGCEEIENSEELFQNEDKKQPTKPDEPLDLNPEDDQDENKSKKSSNEGFPDFGGDSDEEEESAAKERTENLLNLFEGNDSLSFR